MLEQSLAQLKSKFDSLGCDKQELDNSCQGLKETVRALQFQVDGLGQEKDSLSSEVESKQSSIRKLEMEICKSCQYVRTYLQ